MTGPATPRRRDWIRDPRFLLVLLAIGINLPFLFKPFHVDDRIYLEIADQIIRNPLFPYDYPVVFEGIVTPDAASHSHLPLSSYYLALLKLATGSDAEWVAHLAFLIFPALLAWGFYDLAARFCRHPGAATAILLASPGVLVLGQGLMADVPLLAFWVLALSRYPRICRGEAGRWDGPVCVLALVAAAMISMLTAGLMLLMAAYWAALKVQGKADGGWRALVLLLAPLLVWTFWFARAYLHYDRLVLVNTFLHLNKREAFDGGRAAVKLLSFVLNLGGTLLFPAALWYGVLRSMSLRIFLLAFFLSFVPFYLWVDGWTWPRTFLFAAFFSTGLAAIWGIVQQIPRNLKTSTARDWMLPLWATGILAACMLLYYAGSVRYTLLAAPPVILIWLRLLERKLEGDAYFLRNLVWLGFFLTLPYSLWIARGDYGVAVMYRDAAREVVQEYSSPERTVWFTAEWGLRYYLERAGARALPRTGVGPKPGDILVKPYQASPWVTLYDKKEYSRFVKRIPLSSPGSVHTLDSTSRAGFYSTGWGILPWSLKTGEDWEWINVFEIRAQYDGPIPEQERHW